MLDDIFVPLLETVPLIDTSDTTTVIMLPNNRQVDITDPTDDHILYLPPVASCVGNVYSIYMTANSNAKTVTVTVNTEDNPTELIVDSSWKVSSIALDTAYHYLLLYSTGDYWVLANGVYT